MNAAPKFKGRLILFGLWVILFLALLVFRRVALPFALALVLSYLLEPLVRRLANISVQGWFIPRWLAVIMIYLVIFILLYLFVRLAIPQMYGELVEIGRRGKRFFNSLTPDRINQLARKLEDWLFSKGIPVELSAPSSGNDSSAPYGLSLDIEQSIRQGLDKLSLALKAHFFDAVGFLKRLISQILQLIFSLFFILMVTAFMLHDWEQLGDFFRSLVPAERQADYDRIVHAIDEGLAGVVRGQAIICLVNGTLTAMGLLIWGMPFVFVLSTFATVLSAIPIFGTIISSVPIVLVGLIHSLKTGLGILAWILGIHALEAYVLNPKIMGAHAKIHPVVVAFALLAGKATFGFVGALFAVPVTSILVSLFVSAHVRARQLVTNEPNPRD